MFLYAGQIVEQSLLFFPLVLGLYLSFSILKIADLTVDGSLVLGASIFAKLMSLNWSWGLAMLIALVGGFLSGLATALIQRKNRVDPLIAGILMAFVLNSLSLIVMQRPNISLLSYPSIFSSVAHYFSFSLPLARVLVLLVIGIVISVLLSLFLSSKTGLWLKAFGNNADLVALLGKNPEGLRILGLSLSNALASLTGVLIAEASGYADVNMGIGQALIGIAMILIGREILLLLKKKKRNLEIAAIIATFLGVTLYFVLTNELIRYGLSPVYLKMAIGAFLIIFLMATADVAVSNKRRAG